MNQTNYNNVAKKSNEQNDKKMSQTNYNNVAKKSNEQNDEKNKDIAKKVTVLKGRIVNCEALNMRAKASIDSQIISVIHTDDVLSINIDNSTEEWLEVSVNNVNGFCMKKYVSINN